MKRLFLFIILVLWSASLAVDEWKSFSHPFPINDAMAFGDGVLLATDAGIRYRHVGGDYVYHPETGLETSIFNALASSELGVFAVSEFGIVTALEDGGKRWRVMNRSYVANNVKTIPGATVIGKTVLVIPFTDRLAFFDLVSATSILTINRIGNESLLSNPVDKMVVHGDSLYIRLNNNSIFVRAMDWEHLSSDFRLSDPATWTALPATQEIPGLEIYDPTKVVVNGITLDDEILYDAGTSKIKWVIPKGDDYYLVGNFHIYYFDQRSGKKNFTELTQYSAFQLSQIYELKALPTGGAMVATANGILSYSDTYGWRVPKFAYNQLLSSVSSYDSRLKELSYLPDGHVFFHIWGHAYLVYSNWGEDLDIAITSENKQCIDYFMEQEKYMTSISTTPAPDNSGFLTAASSNYGYTLVYVTKNGDVHCANNVGDNPHAGALFATFDEDSSWVIYVGNRECNGYACPGNLEVFKFPAPKYNGGELSNYTKKVYSGLTPGAIDMTYDTQEKRLWLVTTSGLYYFDDERDTVVTPSSANGLIGADYSAIDIDTHGNLWLGSTNQGAYRLTQKNKSPDTLTVQHFTTRNGLLDNNIADLAIDPVIGVAWFAHEKGVTYYKRNDLKNASENTIATSAVNVHAYPVPYRPKIHGLFTIEGFTEESTVSIFNRGGALVRSFNKDEVAGGKLEWNGFDKSGKLVAPGVYYYVINNGSKVKKGKFIIVH